MDYKKLISKVKSVRNYKNKTVDIEVLDELKNFYEKGKKLINDIEIEVFIKGKEDVFRQIKGDAGYKENMIEAPHYIIILSEEKKYYIENTGYAVQGLILKSYELGLGSCWITFKDGDLIKKNLVIDSDKKLTAIIALGYAENETKVIDDSKLQYNPSKADIKIVENNVSYRLGVEDIVFMNEWGKCADADELQNWGLFDGFEYARLAPSTLNRQPWRFIIDDNLVVLSIRKDANINEYEDKIDTGIVMLYFESIIDSTLFDITWVMGKPEKTYNIPNDYMIVGYSKI